VRADSKLGWAILGLLAALLAGCASGYPKADQVPTTEPLPIDGIWHDTTTKVDVRIQRGRYIAEQEFPVFVSVIRKGEAMNVNLRRVGPRRYEAWNPVFLGPSFFTVNADGSLGLLAQTKFFGDYQATLLPVKIDDPAAHKAEVRLAEPSAFWFQQRETSRGFAARNPGRIVADTGGGGPTPPPPARPPSRIAPPRDADPLPALPVPSGVSFGAYHALLIGNDAYRNLPKLRSATVDVTAIDQLLRKKYGFKTKVLKNATRDQMLHALEDYRKNLGANDNLLVYYAGHGWLDEAADEGYWMPVDATQDSQVNWIPNATLTSTFKALSAKQVFVVADSCYSGKLTRGLRVQAPKGNDYLQKIARKRGRIVLSSGGLEPVLDGGGGKHSVFAASFLRALREANGVLDTAGLFSRVRRDVMLNADQSPELADMRKADHQGGDFLFVPTQ